MNDPTPESADASAESELASALSALTPAATRLDAPAALFAAGRAAGAADAVAARRSLHRSLAAWRSLAAVLAVVTTVSIAGNVRLMTAGPSPQLVTSPQPISPVPPASAPTDPPAAPGKPIVADQTPDPFPDQPPMLATASPADSLLALRTAVLRDGVDALPRQSFGGDASPMRIGTLPSP